MTMFLDHPSLIEGNFYCKFVSVWLPNPRYKMDVFENINFRKSSFSEDHSDHIL